MLTKFLVPMQRAGLNALNISLDTLNRVKYEQITRRKGFERVIAGIDLAIQLGFKPKINCVVMNNFNANELCDFVEFTKDRNVDVRFIEYMPFSGNKWDTEKMITYRWVATISCISRKSWIYFYFFSIADITAICWQWSEPNIQTCMRSRISQTTHPRRIRLAILPAKSASSHRWQSIFAALVIGYVLRPTVISRYAETITTFDWRNALNDGLLALAGVFVWEQRDFVEGCHPEQLLRRRFIGNDCSRRQA